MLKKEMVEINDWTARKAAKGFQMKNIFFVPGLLTLALAFALIFTGCRTGDNVNNDPKTLVITGIPSDVFNDVVENYGSYTYNKYILTGSIKLYPIGTTYHQTSGASVAGANLHNSDIIISSSRPYTITIPLYAGLDVRWNGTGTFDVYLGLWDSDSSRYYRADSISFSSETTNVPFSNVNASTIIQELDQNEFVRFSTNDPREYDMAWWWLYENGYDKNTYEIDCKKISGAGGYGYGMLFGADGNNVNKFYYLAIFIDGTYSIDKFNDGVYTEIKALEKSDKLHTGYDVTNILKVVKDGTKYTVYLNNSQVYEFTDSEINGNRLGYRVRIGSQNAELFPNTPVDVRFKRK